MSPFFTSDRWPALESAAIAWVGTPFAPRAGIRSAGACCHRLCVGVLHDAGFAITQDEVPDSIFALNRATHHAGSVIADWLDTQPSRFSPSSDVQPGDVLLLRLGVGAHHAAIALPGDRIIHTWQHTGAVIVCITPKLTARIAHIYRPNEQQS
jgi:cell wall-associated NlpC family hydrolase